MWPSLFFPTVRMHVPGGLRLNSNDHLFVEVSQCFSMFWNKSLEIFRLGSTICSESWWTVRVWPAVTRWCFDCNVLKGNWWTHTHTHTDDYSEGSQLLLIPSTHRWTRDTCSSSWCYWTLQASVNLFNDSGVTLCENTTGLIITSIVHNCLHNIMLY